MTALTDPLAEGAVQAVLAAGRLLADPAAVRSIRAKSETDFVTNVDLAVQEFLREHLAALAPDVQFMAEEQDNSALDLNGKDLALDRERTERLTHDLGKKLGIPVVSGSDTHQAVQYGCVTTVFEREVDTVPALYGEMTAGRYAIDLSDTAAFQVRTACLLKRSLKEIHALGGDYVAILTREATA